MHASQVTLSATAFPASPSLRARALGEAGKLIAERITWDGCIDALLA